MVWDSTGLLLFLIWLALPPLYVVLLGRYYVRRCAESAQQAVWEREELQRELDDLRAALEQLKPPEPESEDEPSAQQYRVEDTQELCAAFSESGQTGRHWLRRPALVDVNG